MTVTRTQKTHNGKTWVLLTGTAAEVLQELADSGASASNVVRVADDATSAIFCTAN